MKRILCIIAVAAGVVGATAAPATAHVPNVHANCDGVQVMLSHYEGGAGNNVLYLSRDGGAYQATPFGASLSKLVPWIAPQTVHSFSWYINANINQGDPSRWDTQPTGEAIADCPAPPDTTGASTSTTSTTTTAPPASSSSSPESTVVPSTSSPSSSSTSPPESSSPGSSTSAPSSSVSSTPSSTVRSSSGSTPSPSTVHNTGSSSSAALSELPVTGSSSGSTAGLASAVLGLGVLLMWIRRPRRA